MSVIAADRALLARLSAVNQHMGEIVLRLLSDAYVDADLTAPDLRSVGSGLLRLAGELAEVGTAMFGRAEEIDSTPGVPVVPAVPAEAVTDRKGGAMPETL